jgi:hypothetical protein
MGNGLTRPSVAEYVVPELHPWWSEEVMKKTETSAKVNDGLFGFSCERRKVDSGEDSLKPKRFRSCTWPTFIVSRI